MHVQKCTRVCVDIGLCVCMMLRGQFEGICSLLYCSSSGDTPLGFVARVIESVTLSGLRVYCCEDTL